VNSHVLWWVFPKWAWSGSREQFLHCGLRKFRHRKSSVYRWHPQLVCGQFVYNTCSTMEATQSRDGWVHIFTTHCPTVILQLHNFDLFRTCRSLRVASALLRGNWQDFNWHDALRGPSTIAELLVYRPDALPAAQPTASKHWRHFCHTEKLFSILVWQIIIKWPTQSSCQLSFSCQEALISETTNAQHD